MKTPRYSIETLCAYLTQRLIASFEQIRQKLGNPARATIFRLFEKAEVLSSYSHRGKYYTLRSIPRFGAQGLWKALRGAEAAAGVPSLPLRSAHGLRRMVAGEVLRETGDLVLPRTSSATPISASCSGISNGATIGSRRSRSSSTRPMNQHRNRNLTVTQKRHPKRAASKYLSVLELPRATGRSRTDDHSITNRELYH